VLDVTAKPSTPETDAMPDPPSSVTVIVTATGVTLANAPSSTISADMDTTGFALSVQGSRPSML